MTTQTQYRPQLRLGEEMLEDATLEDALRELEEAKARLVDAKGYVEDRIDQLATMNDIEGEYRVGPYRLKITRKRSWGFSVVKAKGRS
jgi:hypothetical protein